MSGAIERLEVTRAQLRLALMPPPPPPKPAAPATAAAWYERLLDLPVVHAVIDAMQGWWQSSPVRPVAEVAAEATGTFVRPVARHHPILFVLAAALVGAALAKIRPWRFFLRSALFAGMIPRIASRLVSTMPLESWMSMFNSVTRKPVRPPNVAPAGPADPAMP